MTRSFEGKVVIVTGSSTGIGREAARRFALEGAKVTITGRNADSLKKTKEALLAAGATPATICEVLGDLTSEETAKNIVEETINKFGQLDVLVNNAGGIPVTTFEPHIESPISAFDYCINLNTRSVVLLVQHAVPHLAKTRGAIVNISSIGALPFTMESHIYYGMAKAALDQLTVQLAGNLISKGIRVNSVNPGVIATDFIQKVGVSDDVANKLYNDRGSDTNLTPIGRPGRPDDIAKVILFLADREQSEFIIGQRIVADGGSVLRNCLISASLKLE